MPYKDVEIYGWRRDQRMSKCIMLHWLSKSISIIHLVVNPLDPLCATWTVNKLFLLHVLVHFAWLLCIRSFSFCRVILGSWRMVVSDTLENIAIIHFNFKPACCINANSNRIRFYFVFVHFVNLSFSQYIECVCI